MSGHLPASLLPLTMPLSWAYRVTVAVRNRRLDAGRGVVRFDVPVISVGNITVGGAGKTPMVAWICDRLREASHRPVIAMRGYAARAGEMSDEQAEYAARLPSVPVVAQANRIAALRDVLPPKEPGASLPHSPPREVWPEIDCIVLDDGFQHRQIARDVDLVLIDATQETFNDRLLPAGRLREPLKNLARADHVIVTRAERVDAALLKQIRRFHGRDPLAWARHRWTALLFVTDADAPRQLDWLRGKRVVCLAGIGNPAAFRKQLCQLHVETVMDFPVRDHQRYGPALVRNLERRCLGADALVTTMKDWVKLRSVLDFARWPVPVVVPRLAIEVFEGEQPLRERVQTLVTNRSKFPLPGIRA